MRISVIGAGSWGTAIAGLLADKHSDVLLWVRSSELMESIQQNKENQRYLPGVVLPANLKYTSSLEQAAKADILVIVTPSHAVRETSQKLAPHISPESVMVTASKGLELGTFKRMSEIIEEEIPLLKGRVAALSGPNHAEEVGLKVPSATVVAAPKRAIAEIIQEIFITSYFRVYTNPDIIGVELGGALKNIIALAAGIADGLSFGDNSKSALMTRGLAEIARLGIAMSANPLTFAGLSGVGDLIATCSSRHSRNRRAGVLIAQGKTVDEITRESNMVVEGIRATKAAYQLSQKYQVPMPITCELYRVLYEQNDPRLGVYQLMMRSRTHEVEDVVIESTLANW